MFCCSIVSKAFSLKPEISTFIQSTCPVVQDEVAEIRKFYNITKGGACRTREGFAGRRLSRASKHKCR